MLVMAIEAAKQVAEQGRPIDGFNIQEAKFHAAMRVPPGAHGIETNFYLRPAKGMESKTSNCFEFRLCTLGNEVWTENCTGIVQTVYTPNDTNPEIERRHEEELWNSQMEAYSDAVKACTLPVDGSSLYDQLQRSGYGYGNAFQLIKTASLSPEQPCVIANVERFLSSAGETIHPTTLDAILQTSIWTTVTSETDSIPTAIPTSIESLWVSSQLFGTESSKILKTHATRSKESTFLGASVEIVVFDEALQNTLISIQGLGTNVVSEETSMDAEVATADLCYLFEWKPDPSLQSNMELMALCKKAHPKMADPEDLFTDLDFVLMARITSTLETLFKEDIKPMKPHLHNYVDWMKHQQSMLKQSQHRFHAEAWKGRLTDVDFVDAIETRLLNVNKRSSLYISVARNLLALLAGEIDISNFLSEGEKLKEFYYDEVCLFFILLLFLLIRKLAP
jgi:hypothetical protein